VRYWVAFFLVRIVTYNVIFFIAIKQGIKATPTVGVLIWLIGVIVWWIFSVIYTARYCYINRENLRWTWRRVRGIS
jgi:hypothetical protein